MSFATAGDATVLYPPSGDPAVDLGSFEWQLKALRINPPGAGLPISYDRRLE